MPDVCSDARSLEFFINVLLKSNNRRAEIMALRAIVGFLLNNERNEFKPARRPVSSIKLSFIYLMRRITFPVSIVLVISTKFMKR